MKKFFIILIILCTALFLSLKWYIASDKFHYHITQQLENLLDKKVEFSKINLSFQSIILQNFIVYEENQKDNPIFNAEKIYIFIDIKQLKTKNLINIIKSIKIKTSFKNIPIEIDIKLNLDKTFTIENLIINTPDFKIVNIDKGTFKFNENNFDLDIDLLLNTKYSEDISNLQYLSFLKNIKELKLNGEFKSKFNLKIQDLNNIFINGNLDLTNTEINYNFIKKPLGLNCNIDYNIKYSQPSLIFEKIKLNFPDQKQTINLYGYYTNKNKKFNLNMNFKNLNFDLFASKISKLSGGIFISNNELFIKKFNGFIDENKFEYEVLLSEKGKNRFNLKISEFDISKIINQQNYSYWIFFAPFLLEKHLKNDINGALIFYNLKFKNLTFENLFSNIFVNNKCVEFTNMKSNFQNGKIEGNIKFDITKFFTTRAYEDILFKSNFNIENTEANGILKVFGLKYNITGQLNGTITADGKIYKTKLEDFNIALDLTANNGEFQNITIFNQFAQTFGKKDSSFSNLKYTQSSLKAKIEKSDLKITEFKTNTEDLGLIEVSGNINFINESLDLILDFEVNKKNPLIKKLIIKGTFDKPKYQIVLTDIVKNLGENIITLAPNLLKQIKNKIT